MTFCKYILIILLCSCRPHSKLTLIIQPQCSAIQINNNIVAVRCEDGSEGILHSGKDGRDGIDGANGLDGLPGRDGTDGRAGANGLDGQPGRDGIDGREGPQGLQGIRGLPGLQGPRGLTGAQGQQGLVGLTGPKGDTGEQGPQGLNGVSGGLSTWCGISTQTYTGNIGGYTGAKLICEATCNSPSAHMCNENEIQYSWQLGIDTSIGTPIGIGTPEIPDGWGSWTISNSEFGYGNNIYDGSPQFWYNCQNWTYQGVDRFGLVTSSWRPDVIHYSTHLVECWRRLPVSCCD